MISLAGRDILHGWGKFVLTGVGLLAAAALFIYWQVWAVGHGGRYPAGVFSGYAAGIGILAAQAVLVRALETVPEVRKQIEEREP